MKLNNPKTFLPNHNQYVLGFFPKRPWHDDDTLNSEHKWKVVKFIKGLSKKDRELLDPNDLRKRTYRSCDENSNNLVPYCWDEFGPSNFFGQECKYWCKLPSLN